MIQYWIEDIKKVSITFSLSCGKGLLVYVNINLLSQYKSVNVELVQKTVCDIQFPAATIKFVQRTVSVIEKLFTEKVLS